MLTAAGWNTFSIKINCKAQDKNALSLFNGKIYWHIFKAFYYFNVLKMDQVNFWKL